MNSPGARFRLALLSAVVLAAPFTSTAGDLPVRGFSLWLSDGPTGRAFQFVALDNSIRGPFPDPRVTGADVVVHGSNASGQCHAEISLPAGGWHLGRGFIYSDPTGAQGGVFHAALKKGRLEVLASGTEFPCDASALEQTLPLSVDVRIGTDRYCSAFGGFIAMNELGAFLATAAPAPAACLDADLTVANLNVLHGTACPFVGGGDPNDFCRAPDRADLLFDWIADAGCPDVVTLQEISSFPPILAWQDLIDARRTTACPFPYNQVYVPHNGLDDQIILSRYDILGTPETRVLFRGFRSATWARVDHPAGPVDVVSTHLASGSDNATGPCNAASSCPAVCLDAGAATIRECQAVETRAFMQSHHDVDAPAVITGDMNAEPGTFTYGVFAAGGWVDTHLAAGNPECDPTTGDGCTSGREGADLSELESPASNQDRRIDYTFLVPPGPASVCAAAYDPASDPDGDGSATRIFADTSNPFVATCGALPLDVCHPSDHEGSELDVNCF